MRRGRRHGGAGHCHATGAERVNGHNEVRASDSSVPRFPLACGAPFNRRRGIESNISKSKRAAKARCMTELRGRLSVYPVTIRSPSAAVMHEIIYLIGLIVVVMFVLGALGLR